MREPCPSSGSRDLYYYYHIYVNLVGTFENDQAMIQATKHMAYMSNVDHIEYSPLHMPYDQGLAGVGFPKATKHMAYKSHVGHNDLGQEWVTLTLG